MRGVRKRGEGAAFLNKNARIFLLGHSIVDGSGAKLLTTSVLRSLIQFEVKLN